jgi:hypothetical protein
MTYEEALQIAMEELYDAVIDLRYNNKGYHAHIEAQCNRLLTARNVLCKALEEKREWRGLTEEERESVFAGSYVIYNDETIDKVEAILKEKNT